MRVHQFVLDRFRVCRHALAEFPSGRTIVLLDNFENVVDAETQAITEGGLEEALRAAIEAPPHGVKFVLTTRVAPQALLRLQPSLQQVLTLDEGSPRRTSRTC